MISRRRFLRAFAGVAVSGAGLALYTFEIEPHWLELVSRPLPITNLPPGLQGRTLVQISDVHVGPRVADSYIFDTFARIKALAPDIVVYTGDYISYQPPVLAHAEHAYADAPRGRLATFGILGNHDYGPGWGRLELANRLVERLTAVGIRILRNEVGEAGGLQVAGADEFWAHRFDLRRTLDGLDPTRPAIVLSHNPDTVDLAGWDGYRGWILSGHTHGGQCKPPFLPPPILPVRNKRYTSGEFALTGDRRLYISRGVGHLRQVRFNVRPEVTVFELESV
jgi:predicted MPP superfamily phosphohydrolase